MTSDTCVAPLYKYHFKKAHPRVSLITKPSPLCNTCVSFFCDVPLFHPSSIIDTGAFRLIACSSGKHRFPFPAHNRKTAHTHKIKRNRKPMFGLNQVDEKDLLRKASKAAPNEEGRSSIRRRRADSSEQPPAMKSNNMEHAKIMDDHHGSSRCATPKKKEKSKKTMVK